jgi:hypothetical protein
VDGKLVRWTVPAELPCYTGWDFRIHPGTFDLPAAPVIAGIRAFVAERRQYFARNRINGSGYRSYLEHIAGLDWLEDALRRSDLVVWDWPEDLVWHLVSELVYSGEWARAYCPTCRAEHRPGAGQVVEWSFGSGLAAEGGRRYLCPAGHTLYAIMDWNS